MSTSKHLPRIPETAIEKLSTFCYSYSLPENDELFCQLLTTLISGNYATLNNFSKTCLPNYFDALENMLPAVCMLKDERAQLQQQKEEQSHVSSKWARLICPPE
ncbi:MAG: hypothetical protein WKF68_13835 [Daejeonella sp.]